jgi:hypothetical protein
LTSRQTDRPDVSTVSRRTPLRAAHSRTIGADETLVRYLANPVTRRVGGGLLALAVAVALFTRYGIGGSLSRDEGIYSYAGQQLARGVPPYASIFDPKAPLASMIAGAAAWTARLVHSNDIYAIRAAFFACSLLTVLGVYLLAVRLFGSTLAGLTAAVVLSASRPFALDALAGPDAKTPAVLFAVGCMLLLSRRRWFWGALAGSLAMLVWQPLVIYPVVAVVVALLSGGRHRWRSFGAAVAGAATPVLLVSLYFALAGAFGQFLESAVVFPLTGIDHGAETLPTRLWHIAGVVTRQYGLGGVLFWVGLVLLCVVAGARVTRRRDSLASALTAPIVSVVLVTLAWNVAYAATDFQSYPDLYPFLPYPALGLGGAVAALVAGRRSSPPRARRATVAVLVALAVLTGAAWAAFSSDPVGDRELRDQLSSACAVRRAQVPGSPVWSLGDPSVLVVTHRTNPDRFVYLSSGVDRWKESHTVGGFAGWTAQIRRADPSVIVLRGWSGKRREQMAAWLRDSGYKTGFFGTWHVFLTPEARFRAAERGARLTYGPMKVATDPGGRELPGWHCG